MIIVVISSVVLWIQYGWVVIHLNQGVQCLEYSIFSISGVHDILHFEYCIYLRLFVSLIVWWRRFVFFWWIRWRHRVWSALKHLHSIKIKNERTKKTPTLQFYHQFIILLIFVHKVTVHLTNEIKKFCLTVLNTVVIVKCSVLFFTLGLHVTKIFRFLNIILKIWKQLDQTR